MQVSATERAAGVIERAKRARPGHLTITIGTGCCESTAPFLYEDFWPGPDQQVVGEVVGVEVFAPDYLRALYPGDEGVVIDVSDGPAESLSIETEWDFRLFLRGMGVDRGADEVCDVSSPAQDDGPGLLAEKPLGSHVTGELPEVLRRVRLR
jgi:uncharacterized protein (DUF779 family)